MKKVAIIFKKEMRDMFRDKRVRNSSFLGPLMTVAMIMFAFGFLLDALSKPQNQKVYIVKTSNSIVDGLRKQGMQVEDIPNLSAGRTLVRDGKARVVLSFDQDFDRKIETNQTTTITAIYNRADQASMVTLGMLQDAFDAKNRELRNALLSAHNISLSQAEPIKLVKEDAEKGGAASNDVLIGFLPYLIVIWAFYGGMSIVTDIVAGEKEKNTLETLLITPVSRRAIALGKFLSLAAICLLSSLSALVGVYAVALLNLPITRKLFENGVGLTPAAAGVIVLVIVPSVALFSSVMIAVSAYSRNVRESQSYLTLISFVVLMPAIASQFIGYTDAGSSWWVNCIPVLNAANTIRSALFGRFDGMAIGTTVAVSAILALIAMRIVIYLFGREEVLTRL